MLNREIALAYENQGIKLYLAGGGRPFRPAPAKDGFLEEAGQAPLVLLSDRDQTLAFQLIVASERDIQMKRIEARGLLEGEEFQSLSTEGTDAMGRRFLKTMPVRGGEPWPMWCLIRLQQPGRRRLTLQVETCEGTFKLPVEIEVSPNWALHHGEDQGENLARLAWLNSDRGIGEKIPSPFVPITREGNTLSLLGRKVVLGMNGLPSHIYSFFTGVNDAFSDRGRDILRAPLEYRIEVDGQAAQLEAERLCFEREGEDKVCWRADSRGDGFLATVWGCLEFDGTLYLSAEIRSDRPARAVVRFLHQPASEFSGLFLGLGVQGGKTPETHEWKWAENKRQDAYWIGGVNGGLIVKPRERDMQQSYVNLYYRHGPRNLPESWVNGGQGGFKMRGGDEALLAFESGAVELDKMARRYDVELMISPFRLVDKEKHFATHYYHGGPYKEDRWVEHAWQNGCTHINIHHGNDSYPFINYPMYTPEPIRRVVAQAHSKGIGVKPYYTVRELSAHIPEFWAFRSLREEIYPKPRFEFDGIKGQGGTDDLISQSVAGEVIPAWKHVFREGPYAGITDPSIITNPMSRLANFHVEGLYWMLRQLDIDGIYIDDVGYDRTVMRRIRRIFDEVKPHALIDLHSWNHFEDEFGAGWGHNALLYAQLMPYLDSLWLGESFDYDHTSAEYLLVEVSGLPFGLMGEMLQDGGNPWRGMLYGMTNRFPYQEKSPRPIWALRERFGFEGVQMMGYWDGACPVRANREEVKCTVYYNPQKERYLCCFANFSGQPVRFCPVGIEGRRAFFPEIEGLQGETAYEPGSKIALDSAGGAILWIE